MMKTFSVNKDSWHYKLNVTMVKTNERLNKEDYSERYVQSKDNLCSYWQMTLWSMFKAAAAVAFVCALVGLVLFAIYSYGYALMFHTNQALAATVFVVGGFLFVGSIIYGGSKLSDRKRIKLNRILYEGETETSLTKAQYSSWKNGVCVPVEFK